MRHPSAHDRSLIYAGAILEATGRMSSLNPNGVLADHVPEASAPSQSAGLAACEPERLLSGDRRVRAGASHSAVSRSSDGSGREREDQL